MGDEEDQETMFQEAAKTAWVRLFFREARKGGYPIEDIVALWKQPSSGFCLPENQSQIRPPRRVH